MDSSALPELLSSSASPVAKEAPHGSRPSLLPAFEPVSSSPNLPRPPKRRLDGSPVKSAVDIKRYPTPQATSSTALLTSSSPSRVPVTRPSLNRTVSTVSERVPLGDVPSIELAANGQPVLLGRSSNSSHYQLSANRLISRIHVRASYKGKTDEVLIECLGWNGCTIHCRGQPFVLGKGDFFTSDKPEVSIMLDVQEARVMIRWPEQRPLGSFSARSDATWADDESPQRIRASREEIPSSPPVHGLFHSPVSPSPRRAIQPTAPSTLPGALPSDHRTVEVYEDHASSEEEAEDPPPPESVSAAAQPGTTKASMSSLASSSSSLSSVPDDLDDVLEHNEENDPIIHSFHTGPNLLPRLASLQAATPQPTRREPLRDSDSFSQRASKKLATVASKSFSDLGVDISPIRNHVVNQLAFSRLHSLPLSTIFKALPSSLKSAPNVAVKTCDDSPGHVENTAPDASKTAGRSFNQDDLALLLSTTACVGNIPREGKDAAGKILEDQFYYVPERDADEIRRAAVQSSLGGTGLRSVRKQHKQYYWKRPRF